MSALIATLARRKFTVHDVEEIFKIRPIGLKAKASQVEQVRSLILKYKPGASNE